MFNIYLCYYLQNKAESDVHCVTYTSEIVKDSPAREEPLVSDIISSDVTVENKQASLEPVELAESDEEDEEEEGTGSVLLSSCYQTLFLYITCRVLGVSQVYGSEGYSWDKYQK